MSVEAERLVDEFRERFVAAPEYIARAPGRVNIIGEHTDYSEGLVMPAAIDRDVAVAFCPIEEPCVRIHALDVGEYAEIRLDGRGDSAHASNWSLYVAGVAQALARRGVPVGGMNALFCGDVPAGAGLSSSAALELASAFALMAAASGIEGVPALPPAGVGRRREIALACQEAEHIAVAVKCGIMDQMASALGNAGHALFLDCRSLEHEYVPLASGDDVGLVVYNTGVSRGLAGSEYNTRRAQLEQGVRDIYSYLGEGGQHIRTLRDIGSEQLDEVSGRLDPVILKRCRHVVEENRRVLEARTALASGHAQAAGRLMWKSHESLRLLYEVSCPELDEAVEAAMQVKGVMGSRMTGAGFGGCTVSLVQGYAVDSLAAKLSELGHVNSACYRVSSARGASVEKVT